MDIHSVPIRGTPAAYWDKLTWTVLEDLARNHPDVGVCFQECEIHSRAKDVGTTTAKWFAELLYTDPWFKDVVPNVSGRMEALVLVMRGARLPQRDDGPGGRGRWIRCLAHYHDSYHRWYYTREL